jgi:hypothetical protein
MIMLWTYAAMNTPKWIEWKRKYALRYAMKKWVTENDCDVLDMCMEIERELRVPEGVMLRVHARRNWYLLPDNSYESLEAYIDATRAALVADVRAYQAEVAAFEVAHSKRRSEALKAERPVAASKRTRGSA